MTDSAEVPWDDLKVAFDFEGDEVLLWDTLYPDSKSTLQKSEISLTTSNRTQLRT